MIIIRKYIGKLLQCYEDYNFNKSIEAEDDINGELIRTKGLPNMVHIRIIQQSFDYAESKGNNELYTWYLWNYYWRKIISYKLGNLFFRK